MFGVKNVILLLVMALLESFIKPHTHWVFPTFPAKFLMAKKQTQQKIAFLVYANDVAMSQCSQYFSPFKSPPAEEETFMVKVVIVSDYPFTHVQSEIFLM